VAKNILGIDRTLRLLGWLAQHRPELEKDRRGLPDAAARASRGLGYPVTTGNMSTLARTQEGAWLTKITRPRGTLKPAAALARAILALAGEMGHRFQNDLADELAALAGRTAAEPPRPLLPPADESRAAP
jgi:hypothetical protein